MFMEGRAEEVGGPIIFGMTVCCGLKLSQAL